MSRKQSRKKTRGAADPNKSLQDLERDDWGEPGYDSHLVKTVHRLRRKSLKDFSIEDLRIMIGQGFGLPFLIPIAIKPLTLNSMVEGDLYPGDLLKCVLTVSGDFWDEHPELCRAVVRIVARFQRLPGAVREPAEAFVRKYGL